MGAAGYLFKPQTRKGPVFIAPVNSGAPTITFPDGRTFMDRKIN